jgi:hypothetical protein
VDLSYPRPAIEAMARHATKLTVIDHHLTAAQDLEGLIRHDGVAAGVFDMAKSGCLLTWEWCFKDKRPHRRCWWSATATSAALVTISWVFVTFGDSGSRKQHCHERGEGGELENPCSSMEK